MADTVEGRGMSGDTTAKVRRIPIPLTLFDTLKDASLTFTYDAGENAIFITATRENTRTVKYTITKPTVEKLRRWLRSAITHM
jgi:hypothetical protein